MDRGAWWPTVHRTVKSQTLLSTDTGVTSFHVLEGSKSRANQEASRVLTPHPLAMMWRRVRCFPGRSLHYPLQVCSQQGSPLARIGLWPLSWELWETTEGFLSRGICSSLSFNITLAADWRMDLGEHVRCRETIKEGGKCRHSVVWARVCAWPGAASMRGRRVRQIHETW